MLLLFFPLNICFSRWLTGITAKTALTAINASLFHFYCSSVRVGTLHTPLNSSLCGKSSVYFMYSKVWCVHMTLVVQLDSFMWYTWLPNWSFTDTHRYFSHTCTSECLQYFFSLKFNEKFPVFLLRTTRSRWCFSAWMRKMKMAFFNLSVVRILLIFLKA